MSEFAVWALGVDRPGIVAAVTGVLFDEGCNLEDTSMTILSGHFAMMLFVQAPDGSSPDGLEAALRAAVEPMGLAVAVREVEEGGREIEGEPYMVAVYGADRPGIVHRISTLLSEHGVNITDLTTKVIGDPDDPVYAMHLEVVLPDSVQPGDLADALTDAAQELGVDTSIHPVETDLL